VASELSQSRFALRFFFVSLAVVCAAGGIAQALIRGAGLQQGTMVLPGVFLTTSVLLIIGSGSLQRALNQVRRERQGPFRRSLLAALVAGTAFVSVQSYGLWCLAQAQNPSQAAIGAGSFVLVFAALHALHFVVALLCLVFVTLYGWANRYDHEYYWGVAVCTYFWHALAMIWFCILVVFLIAGL